MITQCRLLQEDLAQLKAALPGMLNETWFDAVTEVGAGDKAGSGFLLSVLRRTKRLAALHAQ